MVGPQNKLWNVNKKNFEKSKKEMKAFSGDDGPRTAQARNEEFHALDSMFKTEKTW